MIYNCIINYIFKTPDNVIDVNFDHFVDDIEFCLDMVSNHHDFVEKGRVSIGIVDIDFEEVENG